MRIPLYVFALLLLFASACSFYTESDKTSVSFEPPVVDRHWEVTHYPADSSGQVCIVTSGHNAIEIIIKKIATRSALQETVHSTRSVTPGVTFTVRTEAHNYTAIGDYFTPSVSKQIIAELLTGEKAYFEWREETGTTRGRADIFHNMAQLKGFKEKYEECRQLLGE